MRFSRGKKGKRPQTARQVAASRKNIKIAQMKRDREIVSAAERNIAKNKSPYRLSRKQKIAQAVGASIYGAAGVAAGGYLGAVVGQQYGGAAGAASGAIAGGVVGGAVSAGRYLARGTISKRYINRKRLEEAGGRTNSSTFNTKRRTKNSFSLKQAQAAGFSYTHGGQLGGVLATVSMKAYNLARRAKPTK